MATKKLTLSSQNEILPVVQALFEEALAPLKTLVSQDLKIKSTDLYFGTPDDFFGMSKQKKLYASILRHVDKGAVAFCNPLETTVALSGLMLNQEVSEIRNQMKSGELGQNLQDGYKEISAKIVEFASAGVAVRDASISFENLHEEVNPSACDLLPAQDYLIVVFQYSLGEFSTLTTYALVAAPLFEAVLGFSGVLDFVQGDGEGLLVDGSLEKTPAERAMQKLWPVIDMEKTVGDAWDLMEEKQVDVLPIVDDEGCVARLITRGDIEIIRSVFFDAPGMEERRSRVMCVPLSLVNKNQQLAFVGVAANLAEVARLMVKNKIQYIPILDGERRLIGMVSNFMILAGLAPDSTSEAAESEKSTEASERAAS